MYSGVGFQQALSYLDAGKQGDIAVLNETVLGGVLAAGAGLVADYFRNWLRERTARKRFSTAIRDDLRQALGIYDRLAEDWQKSQIVWFTTTDQFSASRASYYRNRDWAVLYGEKLRDEIFRYYIDSEQFISGLVSAQRRKGEIQIAFERETMRLRVQINPTTQQLFTDAEARVIVAQQMVAELAELNHATTWLQNGLNRVPEFRAKADTLLNRLKATTWWHRMYGPH